MWGEKREKERKRKNKKPFDFEGAAGWVAKGSLHPASHGQMR